MKPNEIDSKVIERIVAECEGRDWVNTGGETCYAEQYVSTILSYLKDPRKMIPAPKLDDWKQFYSRDPIADIMNYLRNTGGWLTPYLMNLALDNATEDELRHYAIHGRHYVARIEAGRRYCEKKKDLEFQDRHMEGGYSVPSRFVKKTGTGA